MSRRVYNGVQVGHKCNRNSSRLETVVLSVLSCFSLLKDAFEGDKN